MIALFTCIYVSTNKIWKLKLEDGNGLTSYFLISFLKQVQTEGDLLKAGEPQSPAHPTYPLWLDLKIVQSSGGIPKLSYITR